MSRDWDAVAQAIQGRMNDLEMTQTELAARARVAPETVRELRGNLTSRRRNSRTLEAISEALGWRAGHLAAVLAGDESGGVEPFDGSAVKRQLDDLAASIRNLDSRMSRLERIANEPLPRQ